MSEPHLYLFDDRQARRWAPFTLTRPAGEILYGCLTLRERAERSLGTRCRGHLTRRALAGFDEPGACPVVDPDSVDPGHPRILLLSRAVPAFGVEVPTTEPRRLHIDGHPVGWVLPAGVPLPSSDALRDPSAEGGDAPVLELEGEVLGYPWDLVDRNDARIAADVASLWTGGGEPDGAFRIGDGVVSLERDAVVEPGVHLDTRAGPIRLSAGVRVEGPARLVGPLFVGPGSTILGGSVGHASIGPTCLVRGEVTHSIFLGFDNKAHDGHIGHALVGRWVNLGAFTTNSDLKNNYRPVRVWTPDGDRDTGLLKVGCFLGDHVKTGIGTVLNTGTVVGAGSNLYGGLMPPAVVPPFSWGAGADLRDHRLPKFLETARRVLARRGREVTPGVERILRVAWEETAGRRAG